MTTPSQSVIPPSPQGNSILLQLTMEKIKHFDPTNAGFWFDKIYNGLSAANIPNDQIYEIIYTSIPESGQRQIKLEAGEAKDTTELKRKIKNIFDPCPSTKAKAYISNKSLNGKSAVLYVEELIEALGTNSTMLAICFLNVVPNKIEETVKNKLLMQEDIREIASYVDSYINTYLKDEQPIYEITNFKSQDKLPKETTHNETEINLKVDFLRKELEYQKKMNDELSYQIRKIKEEMPIINAMRNFSINDRNKNSYEPRQNSYEPRQNSYEPRHRSYSRDRNNSNIRYRRDSSRQRYDNEGICYGHRKFGDQCYKEKCPPWCKYNKKQDETEDRNKMCYGHKRYGDNCYADKCPPWCIENVSSKNGRMVSTNVQ